MLASGGAYRVITTAEKAGQWASAQGPRAVADYGFDDCPSIDVLVVPGGIGTRQAASDERLLDWLRRRSSAAQIVTSVCTGAALLACAGLLDGRRATSNKAVFRWVSSLGKGVDWVPEARWVEDGNVFTSSGGSAGIDMTLAVIASLEGRDAAVRIAERMEYEWHEDAAWDPFAKIHGLV
jgi:transcriptional regulator GlxA family with amidase domain